jgi:hypothetical protein
MKYAILFANFYLFLGSNIYTPMKIAIRLTFNLFLLFTCFNLCAQNRITDSSATCIAFWKNKDAKVYLVKHRIEKTRAANQTITAEASYEAHIKVKDSTASGFTIEWTYKSLSLPGTMVENTLNSLVKIMEGLKFVYKTADVGTFTELLNWQEVRDAALKNYETALKDPSVKKEYVAALNQVKAVFQSKENIETLLIREVQLFHSPYGTEYGSTGTAVEATIPNVMGGEPFPATIQLKLTELNKKKNYCSINITQAIDKGKAGPIIAEMLKKLSGNAEQDDAEITRETKELNISDVSEYTYTISTGWLSRIFYKRTSSIGSLKQTESYEITEKK